MKKELPKQKVLETIIEDNEYPSAEIAYELAIKSYELSERRFLIVEGRNEKILSYVSSLTLVVVAFLAGSNSPNLNLRSFFFVTALVFGVLSLINSLVVMLFGRIILIDITKIKDMWLHLEEIDFKKEMLVKAGNDFDRNYKVVMRKAFLTSISALLFVLEITFLIIWLITSWTPSSSMIFNSIT